MGGPIPDTSLEELQWSVSTLLFIPAVFLFFFLVGLGWTLTRGRRLAWGLRLVIFLAYGYSSLLTIAPLLGRRFAYLPLWMQILVLVLPLAGIVGYHVGRASVGWVDSSYSWTISLLVLLFLFGTWVARWLQYEPGPSWMPNASDHPWPLVGLYTRAGMFVINRTSQPDQELSEPLLDTTFDIVAFLLLTIVLTAICFICRVQNRARGLQIALVVHPLLLHRYVPEGTICLLASLALAYRLDWSLAREAGRSTLWKRLIGTAILFILAFGISNVVVWKFVALSSLKQWDIVCVAYGSTGLILGRCMAMWNQTAPQLRRPHFSIDQAIIQGRNLRATWARTPIRVDSVVFILPYFLLGLVAVVSSQVRGVRIPMIILITALAFAISVALILGGLQLRSWLKTLRCVPVSRDRMALMRLFSALAHRPSSLNSYEFLSLVLLPIIIPSAVCMYFGVDTLRGMTSTALTIIVTIGVSWWTLAVARSRPPAVLVLGTSSLLSIRLHTAVSRAISPLRAVSLLAFDSQHTTDMLPPRSDCLRTIWQKDWFEIVRGLIELAPFVVIDGRDVSDATLEELGHLHENGHLLRTALVSREESRVPLLEWWDHNRPTSIPASQFYCVAEEHQVGELLQTALAQRRQGANQDVPLNISQFAKTGGAQPSSPLRSVCETIGERVEAFQNKVHELASMLPGCLVLLMIVSPLIIGLLLCAGVISPPKSWGPSPWSEDGTRAHELLQRLDPAVTKDPQERLAATRAIFEIQEWDSVRLAQARAFEDPDERVQVEGLTGLGRCLRDNPRLLVEKNAFGMRVKNGVRLDLIRNLEASRSTRVRMAVVAFWADAAEFRDEAAERLRQMLATERDPDVRTRIEGALTKCDGS
jgi:hypothetical protein